MKSIIRTTDEFLTLQRIMNDYPDAFEEFAKAIFYRDKFMANNERISELISMLDRPYTEYTTRKRDEATRLQSAIRNAIKIGLSVARSLQNNTMLEAFKNYRRSLWHISYHSLSELSLRVVEGISNNMEEALALGLTSKQFTDLQELSSSFREIMQSTLYDLSSRRSARRELSALVKENMEILAYHLDGLVSTLETSSPAFFNAYFTVREKKRRKRKSTSNDSQLCEITGTVTDSVTGLPIDNAVINLASPETILYTDEDGYYLVEDLVAGTYTVSCHLEGYEVPAGVTVTSAAGDSLVVDFALVPAQQQAAA